MRAPALERRSQAPLGRGHLCEADWTAAVERGAASSLREHARALCDQLLGRKDAVHAGLTTCAMCCRASTPPFLAWTWGCITATATALATTTHLALVNSDVVLLPNFVHAFQNVAAQASAVGEFLVFFLLDALCRGSNDMSWGCWYRCCCGGFRS
jgi:hypothetical protein